MRGALADFDMAVYADSTSLVAHYNRGLLLMELGDNNKAIEDFDMVLDVDPDNTLARFNRALLRDAVGDYKGAVNDLSIVIEAYPNFEQAYSCRAEARNKMGDYKGARADEQWLFNRRQEIYFYGVESVQKEYSAEADSARRRSDENVRNYNKMIVPADANAKQYTTEARGKVQNRNTYVELEPLFVLTLYSDDNSGEAHGYSSLVEELNAARDSEPSPAARQIIISPTSTKSQSILPTPMTIPLRAVSVRWTTILCRTLKRRWPMLMLPCRGAAICGTSISCVHSCAINS